MYIYIKIYIKYHCTKIILTIIYLFIILLNY